MKQGITIVLDRPRTLRYGMNALVKIEELTGKNLTNLDLDHISIKDLRTIVYAGLFHEFRFTIQVQHCNQKSDSCRTFQ